MAKPAKKKMSMWTVVMIEKGLVILHSFRATEHAAPTAAARLAGDTTSWVLMLGKAKAIEIFTPVVFHE